MQPALGFRDASRLALSSTGSFQSIVDAFAIDAAPWGGGGPAAPTADSQTGENQIACASLTDSCRKGT